MIIRLNEKSRLNGKFIGNRYWNSGSNACCVVAVRGEVNDWAAYIAGVFVYQSEDEAIEFTYAEGAKLDSKTAHGIFHGRQFTKVLSYRD